MKAELGKTPDFVGAVSRPISAPVPGERHPLDLIPLQGRPLGRGHHPVDAGLCRVFLRLSAGPNRQLGVRIVGFERQMERIWLTGEDHPINRDFHSSSRVNVHTIERHISEEVAPK